ncbi:MAG: pyridoxal-phosphate dependent enzyme, partial [Bacteroidales bacterium]|nr:pyridoxal-phosphate dependent enzyme [Bacteroidales bacterium]
VQKLHNIKKFIPEAIELYCKRDDFIGPLVWGNKLRKLEYSFAEAINQGADTVITTGGMQSNHARTTAQIALQLGLKAILVLNGEFPMHPGGNFLVNKKMAVEMHAVKDRADRMPKMLEIASSLEAQNRKAFIIPLGASDKFGLPGFVNAVRELKQQEEEIGFEFDYIFHASSSGGTQGGLLLGKKLFGLKSRVIGISADSSLQQMQESIINAANPVADRIGLSDSIDNHNVELDTTYIGEGYGIPTTASLEAEKIFAESSGILLDQTYSAKAAAAVLDYYRKGIINQNDKVLLWHTGGTIALFNNKLS